MHPRLSVWAVLAFSASACATDDFTSKAADARAAAAGSSNCSNGRCTVCHVPPGNPANEHTIVISESAVRAHLAHGDRMGPCGAQSCDPVFRDTFERQSGDALGNAELPASPYLEVQGDIDIDTSALVMAADASQNSWAVVSHGGSLPYENVLLQFDLWLGSPVSWAYVGFNASSTAPGASAEDGVGVFIYGSGGGNYVRLREGGVTRIDMTPANLQVGVQYFIELFVNGQTAVGTVSTGDYVSVGGTLVHSFSTNALAQDQSGSFIKVGLDTNAQASPRVNELFVYRGAACAPSPPVE